MMQLTAPETHPKPLPFTGRVGVGSRHAQRRWTPPPTPPVKGRGLIVAGMLMLAACSGGDEEQPAPAPEETATSVTTPDAEPAPTAPAAADEAMARWEENRGYEPDPSEAPPPAVPEPGIGTGDKIIPAAVQGRWGLTAADCTSTKGDAKGLLTIDATTLRFYESLGKLARVRERDASRIVADYKFTGEGMNWDRLMVLDAQGGDTLIRRDYGEGAAAGPLRYTRCAA